MIDGELLVEFKDYAVSSEDDSIYCFGTRYEGTRDYHRGFFNNHGIIDCALVVWNGSNWEDIETCAIYDGREIIEKPIMIPAEWATEQF